MEKKKEKKKACVSDILFWFRHKTAETASLESVR
jgi:hypothetical protein